MVWDATFLAVDLMCLFGLAMLYRGAPDIMQRSAIVWLIFGFLILSLGRATSLAGNKDDAEVLIAFGRGLTHVGVIAYILRLFVAEQARRCLTNFYKHSRN
jgi:hypothetical protein